MESDIRTTGVLQWIECCMREDCPERFVEGGGNEGDISRATLLSDSQRSAIELYFSEIRYRLYKIPPRTKIVRGAVCRKPWRDPMTLLAVEAGIIKPLFRGERGWCFKDFPRKYECELKDIIRKNVPSAGENFSLELVRSSQFVVKTEVLAVPFSMSWLGNSMKKRSYSVQ